MRLRFLNAVKDNTQARFSAGFVQDVALLDTVLPLTHGFYCITASIANSVFTSSDVFYEPYAVRSELAVAIEGGYMAVPADEMCKLYLPIAFYNAASGKLTALNDRNYKVRVNRCAALKAIIKPSGAWESKIKLDSALDLTASGLSKAALAVLSVAGTRTQAETTQSITGAQTIQANIVLDSVIELDAVKTLTVGRGTALFDLGGVVDTAILKSNYSDAPVSFNSAGSINAVLAGRLSGEQDLTAIAQGRSSLNGASGTLDAEQETVIAGTTSNMTLFGETNEGDVTMSWDKTASSLFVEWHKIGAMLTATGKVYLAGTSTGEISAVSLPTTFDVQGLNGTAAATGSLTFSFIGQNTAQIAGSFAPVSFVSTGEISVPAFSSSGGVTFSTLSGTVSDNTRLSVTNSLTLSGTNVAAITLQGGNAPVLGTLTVGDTDLAHAGQLNFSGTSPALKLETKIKLKLDVSTKDFYRRFYFDAT